MAFLGSQTKGVSTQHEEIISVIGNIATIYDSLTLSVDTTNVTNIDILEIRYRPDASEVSPVDLDVLDIYWRNASLKNNAGIHHISVYPTREPDGTYHYEPNHPPNFFYQEHSLHTFLRKNFTLEVRKKSTSGYLNTQNFLIRLKVTKFRSTSLFYDSSMEPAILNQ